MFVLTNNNSAVIFLVMGADIFGTTRLYPIVIGSGDDVYIACTSYGLLYSGESLYAYCIMYKQRFE